MSGNIFFSSHGTAHNRISVCNLTGENVVRVVLEDVDSVNGTLFWSEIGQKQFAINVANTNGSQRMVLVSQIDHPDDRISIHHVV